MVTLRDVVMCPRHRGMLSSMPGRLAGAAMPTLDAFSRHRVAAPERRRLKILLALLLGGLVAVMLFDLLNGAGILARIYFVFGGMHWPFAGQCILLPCL